MSDAEMNQQLREHALARLAELDKLQAESWAAYQILEREIKPLIDRLDKARTAWAAVFSDAEALRKMFPEVAKVEPKCPQCGGLIVLGGDGTNDYCALCGWPAVSTNARG